MKKLNKKGFTLVELLAVIVILGLLMVVAASVMGNVQENSKKASLETETKKLLSTVYQEAQSAYMVNSSDLTQNMKVGSVEKKGAVTAGCYKGTELLKDYTKENCTGEGTVWEEASVAGYTVTGKDGNFEYKIELNGKAQITSYCVTDQKFQSKKTGITAANAVPEAESVEEGTCE